MANLGKTIFERQMLQSRSDAEQARQRKVEDRQYDLRVNQLALQQMNAAEEVKQKDFWQKLQMAQLMGKVSNAAPEYQPQIEDPALKEGLDLGKAAGKYELGLTEARNAWRLPWQESIGERDVANRQLRGTTAEQTHVDRLLGFSNQNDRAALQANVSMRNADEGNKARIEAAKMMREGFNYGRVAAPVQIALQLGRQFHSSQIAKDAQVVSEATGKILSATDDGPGDLALVTAFMKMIDPSTGVRDNEFANALRAGGWLELGKASIDQIMAGKRVSADTRLKFQNATRQIMDAHKKRYDATLQPYREQLRKNGMDEGWLVSDLNLPSSFNMPDTSSSFEE